ncbi:hypothetical protein M011DRAFT_480174 [Sporormia fimetaria CBS 119925]|uniref:Chromatin modification-related protein n=1 Tax=Sporormia fimetaria CBS 119925 TaxID=1340428 RepID=A0A6A6V0P0_9PLEO|nr:hypothetical protein M011DRAFT_480174 [Sporormia fimetaria CBS 119925]
MPPAGSSRGAGASTAPDRRQSARQGRTSVTRPTNYYARPYAGRAVLDETPPASASMPGFVPALTHFSQAVDAFPKELIKHFSLFREVEAKMHEPERDLEPLLASIAQLHVPSIGERRAAAQVKTSGIQSAAGSVNGATYDAARQQQLPAELYPDDFDSLSSEEQEDLKKRRLFYRLRMVILSMLPALEEKLVVLASAKTTKDKGLARMNHSYSQLDNEINAEARYGSLTHWAYAPDKEEKKKGGTERSRREVASANNLAAAAQHVHDTDSIAAKSEARREAMLANKRNRNQHVDSDFDDKPVKKTQKRKAIAPADNASSAIGLGISGGAAAPQSKRKKVDKANAAPPTALPMERSLSGAVQNANAGRAASSPRATPAAENASKRKPRAAPAPTQRKRVLPTNSPPPASSPLASTFAISKATGTSSERPSSSRARNNSTSNSVASAAQEPPSAPRPPSSHSVAQVPNNAITELEQAAGLVRDANSPRGASTPQEVPDNAPGLGSSSLKREEQDAPETEAMDIDPPAPAQPAASRGGRASKTATPVVGTFPETVPMARSRSTRNNGNSQTSSENNSTSGASKRGGHKKSVPSTTAATLPPPSTKQSKEAVKSGPPSSKASSAAPEPEWSEGGEEGEEEPRYCYCNEVSYGNMIACDNDDCPREWFHLACVSLDKVPNSRTKWYCGDACREAATRGNAGKGKGGGGRPTSSRQ